MVCPGRFGAFKRVFLSQHDGSPRSRPTRPRNALEGERGRWGVSRTAAKAVTGGWRSGRRAGSGGYKTTGGQLGAVESRWNETLYGT